MPKKLQDRDLIYPEARLASSEYLTGKRGLPKELNVSDLHKDIVISDLKARLAAQNHPDINIEDLKTESANLRRMSEYDEAKKIREFQKQLDIENLPRHHKGKINAADRMIQSMGFTKELVDAGQSVPTSRIRYLQKVTGKYLPVIGPIMAGVGTLSMPDAAQAATDIVIPGGVESLGEGSDEKGIPDPRYQEYIKRMSQKRK